MSTSERDSEVRVTILRNLEAAARQCEADAVDCRANEDTASAEDLVLGALRYRQLAARAMGCWADADALDGLTANAARSAETASCDAPTIVLEVGHHAV